MTEDSGFFTSSANDVLSSAAAPELMSRSVNGWSELYRVDKDGRFRVYKALKEEYRGNVIYEELLKKEFKIGYSLSNPGICEVYGYHPVPGLGNCIEMEWIDGASLAEILKTRRPSKEHSKRMILQLCDILSYLHSKQIIHRDIKPSNILVTHNGHNVKLIDFGLADSDSYTVIKSPAGTRSFAAPELKNGLPVDNRSDIYSLGKVIELLAPAYSKVARKCTMEDPDRRYSSAEEIAEDIRNPKTVWLWAAIAAVALILLLTFLSVRQNTSRSAQPLPDGTSVADSSEDAEFADTAAIDELFNQATEMIDSKGTE